ERFLGKVSFASVNVSLVLRCIFRLWIRMRGFAGFGSGGREVFRNSPFCQRQCLVGTQMYL
ncbi:MAG: hypothetical protein AAFW00_27735, partial [Bacteroidota bacterium]